MSFRRFFFYFIVFEFYFQFSFYNTIRCDVCPAEWLLFVRGHWTRILLHLGFSKTPFFSMTCCFSCKKKMNQYIYADCFNKFTVQNKVRFFCEYCRITSEVEHVFLNINAVIPFRKL